MRLLKGDLSAPVLAVIVTIGVISAGLVIMAWFWWFAPLAGRTGALVVVGTPVIFYDGSDGGTLTIAVRNTGNADVRIEKIVILGKELVPAKENGNIVKPGDTLTLTLGLQGVSIDNKYAVEGVIIADAGVYTFTAKVIKT